MCRRHGAGGHPPPPGKANPRLGFTLRHTAQLQEPRGTVPGGRKRGSVGKRMTRGQSTAGGTPAPAGQTEPWANPEINLQKSWAWQGEIHQAGARRLRLEGAGRVDAPFLTPGNITAPATLTCSASSSASSSWQTPWHKRTFLRNQTNFEATAATPRGWEASRTINAFFLRSGRSLMSAGQAPPCC